MKKSNAVVDNEVTKNAKFNTLKRKVNNLEKKITDTTTLIHINQYNIDKYYLEKRMEMLIKSIRYEWFSDYNSFRYKD